MYLDLGFRRVGLGAVARPLVAGINTVARRSTAAPRGCASPGPGTLFANFHVVAEVPR